MPKLSQYHLDKHGITQEQFDKAYDTLYERVYGENSVLGRLKSSRETIDRLLPSLNLSEYKLGDEIKALLKKMSTLHSYYEEYGDENKDYFQGRVYSYVEQIRKMLAGHKAKDITTEFVAALLEREKGYAEPWDDHQMDEDRQRLYVWDGWIANPDPPKPRPKEPVKDADYYKAVEAFDPFSADAFNERMRRLEYYNRGDDLSHITIEMNHDEAIEASDDPFRGPYVGWDSDPVDDAHWEQMNLLTERELQQIYVDDLEEQIENLNRVAVQNDKQFHKPKKHWQPEMKDSIEILQKLGIVGESIEVLFNPKDDHAQRDLCVRYGVNVGSATRVRFHVSHYSHMNCYYGKLEGFKQNTVMLALYINKKNKVIPQSVKIDDFTYSVKNVMRPFDEADRYLELERKHLPAGVGFSRYSRGDLLIAHHNIMEELYGDD